MFGVFEFLFCNYLEWWCVEYLVLCFGCLIYPPTLISFCEWEPLPNYKKKKKLFRTKYRFKGGK